MLRTYATVHIFLLESTGVVSLTYIVYPVTVKTDKGQK